jgi:squalene synthase HpnC
MPVDHYENFPVASWLLPHRLHAPVTALYHFARSADDLADEGSQSADERLHALSIYTAELDNIAAEKPCGSPMFLRLAEAVRKHDLPIHLLHDLLDAFRQDITQTRYATYSDLLDYCRRSANPVGRLLLRLFRAESPQQLTCSDAICSSLQLINHWQDVAIDWAKTPARIYLPQEDLQRYGVTEEQIACGLNDANWQNLMRFEVARARALMHEGAPLCRTLPGRIGLELRLIVAGGLRILDKIEAANYDIFRHRPLLRAHDGPRLLWQAMTL